jgi:DNA-binding transcriptional LysR family regulator
MYFLGGSIHSIILPMELRVLRYFLAAAQEENITRAAEKLHITQPSLSRQLMQLEQELGVKLFARGKRRLTLTEDGMFLRRRAEELIALADKTEREFAEHEAFAGGIIAIGCTETMAAAVLPDLLKSFIAQYPNVRYELFCGNSDDVQERLDKGIIDLGIIREPVNAEKYDFIPLQHTDRWGVLLPCDHALVGEAKITPPVLAAQPLLIPSRMVLQNEIIGWFKSAEVYPHVLATYNTLSTAVVLTQQGVGYAVCPEVALTFADRRLVCFRPFTPERVSASALMWKKQQLFSALTDRFLQHAKDAF